MDVPHVIYAELYANQAPPEFTINGEQDPAPTDIPEITDTIREYCLANDINIPNLLVYRNTGGLRIDLTIVKNYNVDGLSLLEESHVTVQISGHLGGGGFRLSEGEIIEIVQQYLEYSTYGRITFSPGENTEPTYEMVDFLLGQGVIPNLPSNIHIIHTCEYAHSQDELGGFVLSWGRTEMELSYDEGTYNVIVQPADLSVNNFQETLLNDAQEPIDYYLITVSNATSERFYRATRNESGNLIVLDNPTN